MSGNCRTVILCGGRGMRLAADVPEVPKPLVEIGGRPLLWHILQNYAACGFLDFILALGYRGEMIKQWFIETPAWRIHDCALDASGEVRVLEKSAYPLQLAMRDTGLDSATGERLRRLRGDLRRTFMVTYGDGLADIDIARLLRFHRRHGKLATVTVVQPRSAFGLIELKGDRVTDFEEKPEMRSWVNGGFFVFEPQVLGCIRAGEALEGAPLQRLIRKGQLMAYRHRGFWQCMDTYKDTLQLNELCRGRSMPWRVARARRP